MEYSKLVAPTGRILSYVENPSVVLPASCTVYYFEDSATPLFSELFSYVGKALVTAAGVNVHLNGFDREYLDRIAKNTGNSKRVFTTKPNKVARNIVQDSMFFDPKVKGNISIVDAIGQVFIDSIYNKDVVYDLSLIRPEGTISSSGQVASGPQSFLSVYEKAEDFGRTRTITSLLSLMSKINEVVRRGGVYKNGALTTTLPIWHPDILEYLKTNPGKDHPWLKKGVVLPSDFRETTSKEVIKEVLKAVNRGDLYLEKAVSPVDNVEWLTQDECIKYGYLLSNVCREVLLESRGTCILTPVNLGQCKDPEDIEKGFVEAMKLLCKFHKANHVSKAGIYLDASIDKQVGLGVIGLANMLSLSDISYKSFVKSLEYLREKLEHILTNEEAYDYLNIFQTRCEGSLEEDNSMCWAASLIKAYLKAAAIAHDNDMLRAFAIAPTAGVSYRNKDYKGYTTTPEISPPVAKKVEPLTSTNEHERKVYNYGEVETASEVGFDLYFRLVSCFQWLQDYTNLGHSISFNLWQTIDYDFLDKWAKSNLKTTYYLLDIDQSFLDKSDQVCTLDNKDSCTSCGG